MTKTIGDVRQENSERIGTNIKEHARDFYQTQEWRNIREEYRKKMREKHEGLIMEVYENNTDKNDPESLLEFIYDPRENPLSEMSLDQGIIEVADVCDHIRDRKLGGSDHEDNLQWITLKQHKIKTLKEQKRESK